MSELLSVCKYLPQSVANALKSVDCSVLSKASELRIRKKNYIVLVVKNTSYFIDYNGDLYYSPGEHCIVIDSESFDKIFMEMCNYSLHSVNEQLKYGFLALEDGIRIGVASRAVYENNCLLAVKDITSLNVRIPREVKGCSKQLLDFLYVNSFPSIIIAGKPNSGKTTLLRDMARLLSSGHNDCYKKIAVIDERGELSGGFGNSALDLGVNTDILVGYNKKSGIETAIRTLSPEMIICDEISTLEEAESIKYGFSSGVSFALSVHISDRQALKNKQIIKALLLSGEFSYIVVLNNYTYNYEILDAAEVLNEINGDIATDFLHVVNRGVNLSKS